MQKRFVSFLKYTLLFFVGVFLVWWSMHQTIPNDKWIFFLQTLRTARYELVPIVVCILLLSHLVRALRWNILIESMGYHPSIGNSFFAVMIGYLANSVVPRSGEVLRCTTLTKYEKIKIEKLMGTVIVERSTDLLCLALVFIVAFIAEYNIIGTLGIALLHRIVVSIQSWYGWELIAVILIIVVIVYGIKLAMRSFAHTRIIIAFKLLLLGLLEGVTSIKNIGRKKLILYSVYSLLIWALYVGSMWFGLLATKSTNQLGIMNAFALLGFGSIGMIITPGGTGAFAIAIAMVLKLYNIPHEIGLANGTLQWVVQTLTVVVFGTISSIALPLYNKKCEARRTSK